MEDRQGYDNLYDFSQVSLFIIIYDFFNLDLVNTFDVLQFFHIHDHDTFNADKDNSVLFS